MLRDDNHTQIQGWMINQYKLKGTELFVFAIIFGFSQTKDAYFTGSIDYLIDWTHASRRTIFSVLDSLRKKNLLIKYGRTKEGNTIYKAVGVQNLHPSAETAEDECKNCTSGVQNLHSESAKIAPNNKVDNKEDIKVDNKVIREKKHAYGEYKNVMLSDSELAKLKEEFPTDWETRIEKVSEYVASKGKTYKNYLATIRNWARMEKEREEKRKAEQRKLIPESERDHRYDALFE